MNRTLLTASFALFTVAGSNPGHTAPVADGTSINVRYADLNLGSSAGEMVLKQRVNVAIDRICGQADIRDFTAVKDVAKCRSDALASTRPQLAALETRSQEFRVASR